MSDENKPKTFAELVVKEQKKEKIKKAYNKVKHLNIPSNALKTSLMRYSLECKKEIHYLMQHHKLFYEDEKCKQKYKLDSKESMTLLELWAKKLNIEYIDNCINDFDNRLDDIVVMLDEKGYLDFALPNKEKENFPNDVFFNLFLSFNTNNSSVTLSSMRDKNGEPIKDNVVSLTYDTSSIDEKNIWRPFKSDLLIVSKMFFSNLSTSKNLDDETSLQETIEQINAIQSTNFRQCIDFFLMRFAKEYSQYCLLHTNKKRVFITNVKLTFTLEELSKLFGWKITRSTRGENKKRLLDILNNIISIGATIVKFKNNEYAKNSENFSENGITNLFEINNKDEYVIDENFNCRKELKFNSCVTLFPKYTDNNDGTFTITLDNDFANYLCRAYFVKYPLDLNYLPNNKIGCNAFLIGKAIAMYLSNSNNEKENRNILSIEKLLAYSSVPTFGRLKQFAKGKQTNRYIKKPLLESLELLANTCYLEYSFLEKTTKNKKTIYQELTLEQVKKMRVEKITKLSLKCKFNSWEHYENLDNKTLV